MKIQLKSIAAMSGGMSFLVTAVLIVWLISWKGTLGLIQWSARWRHIFLAFAALGVLPVLLSLVGLLLSRYAWPVRILPPLSLGFSVLAVLCAVGLFVGLRSLSRPSGEPPSLGLLNPASGIPGSGGAVRLAVSSDPHWGASTADAAAREGILRGVAAGSPRRDALFILGDNVEYGMVDKYWRAEAADLARCLDGMPVRPILGNHDSFMGGQDIFRRYFFPASLATDSGSPYYWSMKAGPARIVVLDLMWGAEEFGEAQSSWLEKTLSSVAKGEQVVVLSHCFFYASGYVDPDGDMPWYDHFGTTAKVSPILERHGVDLVVSGHDHTMELLEHGGVTYALVGSMGGRPDSERTYVSPASLWYRQGMHGWLDLDIDASGISLRFRDGSGGVLHQAFLPVRR